jgi:hypothetical protein
MMVEALMECSGMMVWSSATLRGRRHQPRFRFLSALFEAAAKGELIDGVPDLIRGHVELQKTTDPKEAARPIRQYGSVRESVPISGCRSSSGSVIRHRESLSRDAQRLSIIGGISLRERRRAAESVAEPLGDRMGGG